MKPRAARPIPPHIEGRVATWAVVHFGWHTAAKTTANVNEYVAGRCWGRLSSLLPRPDRWSLFRVLKPYLSDTEYWHLLRETYQDSETIGRQGDLSRLLRAKRPEREAMMTAEERAHLRALSDPVPVFRGCMEYNRHGWSWTLNEERARWFAARSALLEGGNTGLVLRGHIARSAVVAYIDGREEHEVLCDPEAVAVESVDVVPCTASA